ncbi:hypothetical protein ABT120_44160 [Nonomuraea angiospora]|uniref:hypothetical protein n=1 Tax=Nonomuraea angiospora TaxID=46172 RepID=UPI003332D325
MPITTSAFHKPRSLVLLGSTGSIGTQAIDVIERNRDRFRVRAISAGGGDLETLARQALTLGVEYVGIATDRAAAFEEGWARPAACRFPPGSAPPAPTPSIPGSANPEPGRSSTAGCTPPSPRCTPPAPRDPSPGPSRTACSRRTAGPRRRRCSS